MNKILKIILASLLITSFVIPFTIPRPVNAASAPINIGVCTGAGLLANYVSGLIGDLIGSGLAVPVSEGGLRNKEGVLDVAARCFARQLFDSGITGILDVVRKGGRDGSAAYVKDWRNFQTSAEYRGEDVFRAILSNTKLCDYIDKDIKGLFGVTSVVSLPSDVQTRTGNFDPYQLRANCTMPSGFSLTNYQKDFAGNGGWQAFSRLLEPQNNYYGALFGALDESSNQRELEKSADTNEAISGEGYTARRKACQTTGQGARCVVLGTILTPGSTLSGAVQTTFQSELSWLANSDELNEVIASLVERFFNRLLDIGAPDSDQKYGPDPTVPTPSETPPTGVGNDPGAPSSINLSDVVWLDKDVSGWDVTADLNVSLDLSGGKIVVDSSQKDNWPEGTGNGAGANANPWVFVWRNGNWYAGTWEWMRPGQDTKNSAGVDGPALMGELKNFSPQLGDTYGFMMSGLARNNTSNIQERSNIVMVTWQ